MSRRLPPLNALRAFEAAARHESFSAAADELHVTHGAISHQVKALEAWLGLPLFERRTRAVRLTEAGSVYRPVIEAAFNQIHAATTSLLRATGGERDQGSGEGESGRASRAVHLRDPSRCPPRYRSIILSDAAHV